MAKRAPLDEKPYSPVLASLVEAVVRPPAKEVHDASTAPDGTPTEAAEARSQDRILRMPGASRRTKREGEPRALRDGRPSERLVREKRVLLSKSEEAAVGDLVQRLAACGASSIKLSHLLRASIHMLRHSEQEFVERVRRAQDLVRPPNDNPLALAEFEHRLAQELAAAVRASPPLR